MWAADMQATKEELLEAVFSVWSVSMLYKRKLREKACRQSVESCSNCGGGQFGNAEGGERPPLEAATKHSSEVRDWEH
jgi:hypothetical protein